MFRSFVIYLLFAGRLSVANPCCGDPTESYLSCFVNETNPTLQKCSCSVMNSNEIGFNSTSIYTLSLSNVTVTDFSACLSSFPSSVMDGLSQIELEGSNSLSNTRQTQLVETLGLFQLMDLKLQHLGIRTINGSAFDKIGELASLSIAGNILKSLTATTFNSASLMYLNALDASNNRVVDIAADTFSSLTALYTLDLSGNAIATIRPGTFACLADLAELDLSRNNLQEIQRDMVMGLSGLSTLMLKHNQIQRIDFPTSGSVPTNLTCKSSGQRVLSTTLTELILLDLSFNRIQELDSQHPISALTQLEKLHLDRNTITNVTLAPFSALCQLEILNLSRNGIEVIQSSANSNTTRCQTPRLVLDLSWNRLHSLGRDVFREIPHSVAIDVSHNLVEEIHNDSFLGLAKLSVLDIKHNRLQSFVAPNLKGLERLDLSSNKLTTVTPSWLDMVAPDRDGTVVLGGNQLVCNRQMALFFERATCNEVKEYKLYSQDAVETLNSLDKTFSPGETITLPWPGTCVRSDVAGNCSTKQEANMGVCLLSAYLDLASTSPAPNHIFQVLLNSIEDLYHYTRNAEKINSSYNLNRAKQGIVQSLGAVASNLNVQPGEYLVGLLSDGIVLGVTQSDEESRRQAESGTQPSTSHFQHDGNGASNHGTHENILSCNATQSGPSTTVSISIPPSIYTSGKSAKRLSFAVYSDDYLFPSSANVISSIVAADVVGQQVRNTSEPIVVNAVVNMTGLTRKDVRCGYWNLSTLSWSNYGCDLYRVQMLNEVNGSAMVTCHCNHLTNFGILLDYNENGKAVKGDTVTSVISQIGVIASIVGLVLTLLYRLTVPELRRGVPQLILLHLCFCLLFVYILLLISELEVLTNAKELCFVVAVLLHFSLLSLWGWNVTEAVSMYLLLVRVYNVSMRHFLTKATICCYGSAALIAAASIVYSGSTVSMNETSLIDNYTYSNLCAVRHPNNLYFIVLPIGFACLMNCTAFVSIVAGLSRNTKCSGPGSDKGALQKRFRQAVCVTALLGITWCIGLIKVAIKAAGEEGDIARIFNLLFIICNSVQGFVIFAMFCLSRLWSTYFKSSWQKIRSDTTHQRTYKSSEISSSSRHDTRI